MRAMVLLEMELNRPDCAVVVLNYENASPSWILDVR